LLFIRGIVRRCYMTSIRSPLVFVHDTVQVKSIRYIIRDVNWESMLFVCGAAHVKNIRYMLRDVNREFVAFCTRWIIDRACN
jgi:hypothetical protein